MYQSCHMQRIYSQTPSDTVTTEPLRSEEDSMSNYADETNTQDDAYRRRGRLRTRGCADPGDDPNEVNPDTGPDGDVSEEGMETPIAPS